MRTLASLLRLFGGGRRATAGRRCSDEEMEAVRASAQRNADVVAESIAIARESHSAETKLSRLTVAKQKREELEWLLERYPFLRSADQNRMDADLTQLEAAIRTGGYQRMASENAKGSRLEKAGETDEAIAVYEGLVRARADTPHTYRRLAILYRKRKDRPNEERALSAALRNVPKSNATHYGWLSERFEKLTTTRRPARE